MKSASYEKIYRKGKEKEWLEKAGGVRCTELRTGWNFVCPMVNNYLHFRPCFPLPRTPRRKFTASERND